MPFLNALKHPSHSDHHVRVERGPVRKLFPYQESAYVRHDLRLHLKFLDTFGDVDFLLNAGPLSVAFASFPSVGHFCRWPFCSVGIYRTKVAISM
jgi:hypothetical protein